MLTQPISVSFDLGGGREVSIETGKIARQAHGAVTVRQGNCIMMATVVANKEPKEGQEFFPLSVDYMEKFASAGRIPGSFFKREGKPPEKEILTSRLIDRPIRPLFPDGWRYETQIIALVLSADTENDADVLAITGASAALALSEVPFQKTIAGVRVGFIDGNYVINPTHEERKQSLLDLVVAGSKDGIVMVEAGAREVTEPQVVGALEAAHAAIKQIVAAIEELQAACGKPKLAIEAHHVEAGFQAAAEKAMLGPLVAAMRIKDKLENYAAVDKVLADFVATLGDDAEKKADAKHVFHGLKEKALREEILVNGQRLDGRKFDQIRPIWTEATVLPRVHGSVVFTRGETQALVTATLGTAEANALTVTVDPRTNSLLVIARQADIGHPSKAAAILPD